MSEFFWFQKHLYVYMLKEKKEKKKNLHKIVIVPLLFNKKDLFEPAIDLS